LAGQPFTGEPEVPMVGRRGLARGAEAEVLPVAHLHAVFTLPGALGPSRVSKGGVSARVELLSVFADDCRRHAFILMEMAKNSPAPNEHLLALAQSWLALAAIEDQLTVAADRAERESKIN
jgi:hypothetical protein